MGYGYVGTMGESVAGTGAIYQFRLNSVYDPDYSSAGVSAQGYGAYSTLYGLFRVLRTRVICRYYNGTSGNSTVGILPSLNTTMTSTYALIMSQPFAQSRVVQSNAGGNHSVAVFDTTFDLAKIAGVTPAQFKNDFDFAHTAGANPTKSLYLTCFMAGHSASVQQVGFEIRLIYDVEISQPLDTVTG